ncbi:MAG: hypothetical protein AB4080_02115 [Trichodesmium sp.]
MIELTEAKYPNIPQIGNQLNLLIVEDVMEDLDVIVYTLKSWWYKI